MTAPVKARVPLVRSDSAEAVAAFSAMQERGDNKPRWKWNPEEEAFEARLRDADGRLLVAWLDGSEPDAKADGTASA